MGAYGDDLHTYWQSLSRAEKAKYETDCIKAAETVRAYARDEEDAKLLLDALGLV